MEPVVGVADGPDDGADNELQVFHVPGLPGDDLFPVPLVYIDGVDVVQLFVSADGVHVGVEAAPHPEVVPLQCQPLPLGQGVDHLHLGSHRRHIEAHRPLIAVQVVVQARILRDKQGGRHPLQVQGPGKLVLKGLLDVGNGPLGIVGIQGRPIALGNVNMVHRVTLPLSLFNNSIVFKKFTKSRRKRKATFPSFWEFYPLRKWDFLCMILYCADVYLHGADRKIPFPREECAFPRKIWGKCPFSPEKKGKTFPAGG